MDKYLVRCVILCSLEISAFSNRLLDGAELLAGAASAAARSWGTSIRLHISNADAIHGMIPRSLQFTTKNKPSIPSANRVRNPN